MLEIDGLGEGLTSMAGIGMMYGKGLTGLDGLNRSEWDWMNRRRIGKGRTRMDGQGREGCDCITTMDRSTVLDEDLHRQSADLVWTIPASPFYRLK